MFAEYCLDFLVQLLKKARFLPLFFSFSFGIFLQPKRVWKEKGPLGRLRCGDQARSGGSKEKKLWNTDACCDGPDGSVYSNRLIHPCLIVWSPASFVAYP
jgi:hypothetical protein